MLCRLALDAAHSGSVSRLIGAEFASTASSSFRRPYEEQLSCGESLWRGQTRAYFSRRWRQNKMQPACRATVTGSTCRVTWCQYVGRWRELGLLCACVGKIFWGPAESNTAECATLAVFVPPPPPFFCPLPPSDIKTAYENRSSCLKMSCCKLLSAVWAYLLAVW